MTNQRGALIVKQVRALYLLNLATTLRNDNHHQTSLFILFISKD